MNGINNDDNWNLRVIKHDIDENEISYSIQEVHYDTNGIPDAISEDFVVEAKSLKALNDELSDIKSALNEDAISEYEFLNDVDYPYNTEFGGGHTEEEMENIDNNNQQIQSIMSMVRKYPNNMELGKAIRQTFNHGIVEEGEQLELRFEDQGE